MASVYGSFILLIFKKAKEMNMDYVIEILTERLNLLDISYDKFVKYGNVPIDNKTSIDNRVKANSIKEALKKLKQ